MRRVPVGATIVVALAVAAMVALGLWQLQRRQEKEALLARYAANATLPPIAFPGRGDVLFRRANATCAAVTGWRTEAGRAANGSTGWRQLATCVGHAGGTGYLVDVGVARLPEGHPGWRGGAIDGQVSEAPVHVSLIGRAFAAPVVPVPLLIADTPAPGLLASAKPSLDAIPNNHLAYAVQWFLFAGIALVIYVLALRRRA